jgi:hypothetical protein
MSFFQRVSKSLGDGFRSLPRVVKQGLGFANQARVLFKDNVPKIKQGIETVDKVYNDVVKTSLKPDQQQRFESVLRSARSGVEKAQDFSGKVDRAESILKASRV